LWDPGSICRGNQAPHQTGGRGELTRDAETPDKLRSFDREKDFSIRENSQEGELWRKAGKSSAIEKAA